MRAIVILPTLNNTVTISIFILLVVIILALLSVLIYFIKKLHNQEKQRHELEITEELAVCIEIFKGNDKLYLDYANEAAQKRISRENVRGMLLDTLIKEIVVEEQQEEVLFRCYNSISDEIILSFKDNTVYRLNIKRLSDKSGEKRVLLILIDFTDIHRDVKSLKQKATMDALTNILNKKAIEDACEDYLGARYDDPNRIDALFMIDLDDFKKTNDTLGHIKGDLFLKKFGEFLNSCFRGVDLKGRVGGDEFVCLMKDVKSEKAILDRANLIVNWGKFSSEHNERVLLTACVGVCIIKKDLTYQEAIRCADEMVYQSKREGKKKVHICTLE